MGLLGDVGTLAAASETVQSRQVASELAALSAAIAGY
jgi:hypothetical protein